MTIYIFKLVIYGRMWLISGQVFMWRLIRIVGLVLEM